MATVPEIPRWAASAPAFADIVRKRHLVLLNPHRRAPEGDPAVHVVISRVISAIQRSPDPYREIVALLDEVNWRPNLVGAVAALLGAADAAVMDALWRGIDRGSWFSPQLAVAARLRDPRFAERASARIAAAAQEEPASGAPPLKAVAALVELARDLPEAAGAVDQAGAGSVLGARLRAQLDRGDALAARWREAMVIQYRAMERLSEGCAGPLGLPAGP
ncbi:MAG: hypothetical protein IT372_23460 [Polyangiaceae bacterium]|nr:hypothetical protein [Polyangiaceae bacterium]